MSAASLFEEAGWVAEADDESCTGLVGEFGDSPYLVGIVRPVAGVYRALFASAFGLAALENGASYVSHSVGLALVRDRGFTDRKALLALLVADRGAANTAKEYASESMRDDWSQPRVLQMEKLRMSREARPNADIAERPREIETDLCVGAGESWSYVRHS